MVQLKANQVTHLCCLITGDRFYFANDSKKKVWELRFHTSIKFRGQEKKLSQCKDDNGNKERFDSNRVIIYLRSENPRRQPGYKKVKDNSIDHFFIY